MSLLDDLTDDTPELVMERPGDGVYGVVAKVWSQRTNYRPDGYPVVTVRHADGRLIAVHGRWMVLARLLNDLRLREGDELAVVYDGERESGTGQNYKMFRAESKRPR